MSQLEAEIRFFDSLAEEWWSLSGPQAMLHQINPLRVLWMSRHIDLKGQRVLDVGCGAGILSEALALKGAHITGIDLGENLIQVAKTHAEASNLQIDYQCRAVDAFAAEHPLQFDVVACLEMLEHVDDFEAILNAIAAVLKPGGKVFLSTLDRTPRSFVEAILGAEYLLKLIPKGTHHYTQFIRPDELCRAMRKAGLEPLVMDGLRYHPLSKTFSLTPKPQTNYWVVGQKLS